jgi:hypothetical protein
MCAPSIDLLHLHKNKIQHMSYIIMYVYDYNRRTREHFCLTKCNIWFVLYHTLSAASSLKLILFYFITILLY